MQTTHLQVYLVDGCFVEQYVVGHGQSLRTSRLRGNYFSRSRFVDPGSGAYTCHLRRLAAIDQEDAVSVAASVASLDQQWHDEYDVRRALGDQFRRMFAHRTPDHWMQ